MTAVCLTVSDISLALGLNYRETCVYQDAFITKHSVLIADADLSQSRYFWNNYTHTCKHKSSVYIGDSVTSDERSYISIDPMFSPFTNFKL